MRHRDQRSRRDQSKQRASTCQNARPPPQADQTQDHVRRDDGPELASFKWNQARQQDSRGNGSQRREKRISQVDALLVAQHHGRVNLHRVSGGNIRSGIPATRLRSAVLLRCGDDFVGYGLRCVDIVHFQPA